MDSPNKMMNFTQAVTAAHKSGQNIAGATLGGMMGGSLAQMPGFGGATNASQTPQQPSQQMSSDSGELEGRIAALEQDTKSNIPPAPSNTLGQSQPTFNPQAQQNSALLYGSVAQRQNSVNATPMFKKKCNKKY